MDRATVRNFLGGICSEWTLLSAVIFGTYLRLYLIEEQIVADDEWHAIYVLLHHSYFWIFSHLGISDYSIPLTLFYKLVADTVGLSELWMRLPPLLFGIASVAIFPLFVRNWIGKAGGDAFAWLLAIHPLHVYYSRYARPYSISLFFAFVAVAAFFRYLRDRDRLAGCFYVLCAILASYFHLAFLPIVLLPLFFFFAELCVRRERFNSRLRQLGLIGSQLFAGLLLVLIVPVIKDWKSLMMKSEQYQHTDGTVWGVAQLFTGNSHSWPVVLILLGVVIGILMLVKTDRRFGTYLLVTGVGTVVVVAAAKPGPTQVPVVFVRYSLFLLPILLVLLSVALSSAEARVKRVFRLWPTGTTTLAISVVLFYFGPLPRIYYSPNNWTNHGVFQYTYSDDSPFSYANAMRPSHIPDFYFQLRSFPRGSKTLIEVPFYAAWNNNPYPYYQRIHRQRMLIGFLPDSYGRGGYRDFPLKDDRFNFRLFVLISDRDSLKKADYVIFHRNLGQELADPHKVDAKKVPPPGVPPLDLSPLIEEFAAEYGPPVYRDKFLVVFDVRSQSSDKP